MKKASKLIKPQDLENARIKYQAAVSMSNSEGQIQWVRYSAMLVVNTIFITLIGISYNNKAPLDLLQILFVFIPIPGLLLCYWWHTMTKRGFMWTKFWLSEANRIEDQIDGEINPIQNGADFKSKIDSGVTASASLSIIKIVGIIYLILLIVNSYGLVVKPLH